MTALTTKDLLSATQKQLMIVRELNDTHSNQKGEPDLNLNRAAVALAQLATEIRRVAALEKNLLDNPQGTFLSRGMSKAERTAQLDLNKQLRNVLFIDKDGEKTGLLPESEKFVKATTMTRSFGIRALGFLSHPLVIGSLSMVAGYLGSMYYSPTDVQESFQAGMGRFGCSLTALGNYACAAPK